MMPLLRFVMAKVGVALITMVFVSLIVFAAMRALPGGVDQIILGPIQTQAERDAVAREFGLRDSLPEQYLKWAGAVLSGNLGVSMITREPVAQEIGRRAPATLQLAVMSFLIALVVALPLGIASGVGYGGRPIRLVARLMGGLGAGLPDFVLGTTLVYLFSTWKLWLKVGGYVPFRDAPIANLQSMILPAIALSAPGVALILRTTRESVLGVTTGGHITTAVARGETLAQIVRRQILRNASPAVLTATIMYLAALIGGSVVVETLFSVPGVGLYTWNALNNRDYQVTQSAVLVFALVLIAANMCVDIAYALIDPRIKEGRGQ
jgi:peptide/nickel transport system permease protein